MEPLIISAGGTALNRLMPCIISEKHNQGNCFGSCDVNFAKCFLCYLFASKYEGCINCFISNKLKQMSYETLQSNYSNLYTCNGEKGSVTFISAYVLTFPFNPSIISVIY